MKYIYDRSEQDRVVRAYYEKFKIIISGVTALGYDEQEKMYNIYTDKTQYTFHTHRL